MWIKDWFTKCNNYALLKLLNEIRITDTKDFNNYIQVKEETFNKLSDVRPCRTRRYTVMRESTSPNERLNVNFHYLATGKSFANPQFSRVVGKSTISRIFTRHL